MTELDYLRLAQIQSANRYVFCIVDGEIGRYQLWVDTTGMHLFSESLGREIGIIYWDAT